LKIKLIALFITLIILATTFSFGQAIFKYDPHGKRDPFIPLIDRDGNLLPEIRPAGSTVEINLEGILWDQRGESYAIISGTVLREGDYFGDYKVINIERKRVILTRAGEEITINLSEEEEEE